MIVVDFVDLVTTGYFAHLTMSYDLKKGFWITEHQGYQRIIIVNVKSMAIEVYSVELESPELQEISQILQLLK